MYQLYYRPEDAWVGDIMPCYHDGEYYMYYQCDHRKPKGYPDCEPFGWSLSKSKDMIHFTDYGEVLKKDPEGGREQWLFAGSVILNSALELVTGFVLEKLFHQKWWDYSDMPFNIGGYICLMFSLVWGLACLLIMDVFHPLVDKLVSLIPHTVGVVLLCALSLVMLIDLAATVSTILKLNKKLRRLDELAGRIKSASDDIGEALSGRTLALAEKSAEGREALEEKKALLAEKKAAHEQEESGRRAARETAMQHRREALAALKAANEELLATYDFGQKRLLRAFPSMKSTHHGEALEQMKQRLKNLKK